MSQHELIIVIVLICLLNSLWLVMAIKKVNRIQTEQQRLAKLNKAISGGSLATEKKRLEEAQQLKIESATKTSIDQLQQNLQAFSKKLNDSLSSQATIVLDRELETSKKVIQDFNSSLLNTLKTIDKALLDAGVAARDDMQAGVKQHKQLLIEQFESHMASIISTYIITVLGEQAIDNNQVNRLIQELEAHQDDLKKDILHEV